MTYLSRRDNSQDTQKHFKLRKYEEVELFVRRNTVIFANCHISRIREQLEKNIIRT